jgi:hypothetical protein
VRPRNVSRRAEPVYNKLGLSTAAELEAAEREITHAALILLHESPISPSYDLPHPRAIHKWIFGDIYERAGQIWTVAVAKGTMFCLPQYIDSAAAIIFRELHDEDGTIFPLPVTPMDPNGYSALWPEPGLADGDAVAVARSARRTSRSRVSMMGPCWVAAARRSRARPAS